jgi:hypothetical protein
MKLNQTEMKKIKILFSKTKQQRIVEYIDKQFAFINNIEKELNISEKKISELENGIFKDFFKSIDNDKYKNL